MSDEEHPSKNRAAVKEFTKLFAAKRKKPFSLYTDGPSTINKKYSAEEIIRKVNSEMAIMRNADSSSAGVKTVKTDLKCIKKSEFVPLSSLVPGTIDQKQNKNETQGVTDTQMLDAADGAEAVLQMMSHKGMTQLLDVSFNNKVHLLHDKRTMSVKEPNNICNNVITVNKNASRSNENEVENTKHICFGNYIGCLDQYKMGEEKITCETIKVTETRLRGFQTCISKEGPILENNGNRPPSPVLTTSFVTTGSGTKMLNGAIKRRLSMLQSFEETEESVRKLQKTQEYSKSDNKSETSHLEQMTGDFSKKEIAILSDDEIIFSSDEEGFIEPPRKLLALTCKMDKNIGSDTSEILDDSLYVFFTTASDKSIQVSRDSLENAKNNLSFLLDGEVENNSKQERFQGIEIEDETIQMLNKEDDDKINLNNSLTTQKSPNIFERAYIELNTEQEFDKSQKVQVNIFNNNETTEVGLKNGSSQNNVVESSNLSVAGPNLPNSNDGQTEFRVNAISRAFDSFMDVEHINANNSCKSRHLVTGKHEDTGLVSRSNDSIMHLKCPEEEEYQHFEEKPFHGFELQNNESLRNIQTVLAKAITSIGFTDKEFSKEARSQAHHMCITANDKNMKIADCSEAQPESILKGVQNIRKSHINKETNYTEQPISSKFNGFTTASNKTIRVSKEALAKSVTLFKEISAIEEKNCSPNIKTVSNDTIKVPDKPSTISLNVFKSIANLPIDEMVVENKLENLRKLEDFSTACNNATNEQSRPHFEENGGNPEKDYNICEIKNSTKFQGFTTASNKIIRISKESLAKSRQVFQGIDDVSDREKNSYQIVKPQFTNARNKSVKEEALAKTKSLFKGVKGKSNTAVEIQSLPFDKFHGFTTANNKNITISKEALAQAKKLFLDDVKLSETNNIVIEKNDQPKTLNNKFHGFTTVNNKNIKKSEKALAEAKKLFQDDENISQTNNIQKNDQPEMFSEPTKINTTDSHNSKFPQETPELRNILFENIKEMYTNNMVIDIGNYKHISNHQGFTTASNKTIKVSSAAIANTKNIFENIDVPDIIDENIETTANFKGFTTASNNNIQVSKEALVKTRNIFQEFNDIKFSQVEGTLTKLGGFTTATSKKPVDMLEENKPENIPGGHIDVFNPTKFLGFTTGNNNNIKVSDQALQKSRKLFQDLDCMEEKRKDITNKISTGNNILDHGTKCIETHTIKYDELLNTQIKNNFEETLYTQDFCEEPKNVTSTQNKKPGSPILHCSSTKRRKTNVFKVPYRSDSKVEQNVNNSNKTIEVKTAQTVNKVYNFDDNYKITRSQCIKLKDLQRTQNDSDNIKKVKFDFNNLSDFKFDKTRNDFSDVELDIKELKDIFLNSVDKKIVPNGWLENHLKLILWKLLSYEQFCPQSLSGVATVQNVLQQLKYRYDRELHKVERPALRKILEKDENPGRSMVLCVVRIFADGQELQSATNAANLELEVTDGWYCVRATIDKTLTKAVVGGKIVSGTKLITRGAELLNCDQGIAPWEDTSSVRLRLSGNSTRRAAWHARLGLRRRAPAPPLRALTPEGGKVAALRVHVARVYPLLYVERFDDGSTVTRSERLEALQSARHDAGRRARLERLREEAAAGLEGREGAAGGGEAPDLQVGSVAPASRSERLEALQSARHDAGRRARLERLREEAAAGLEGREGAAGGGEAPDLQVGSVAPASRSERLEALQSARHDAGRRARLERLREEAAAGLEGREGAAGGGEAPDLQTYLTESQVRLANEDGARRRERQLERVHSRMLELMQKMGRELERNVVPLLKVRVCDWSRDPRRANGKDVGGDGLKMTKACFTVWKPSEYLLDVIKEGVWIDAMNVVPTAMRLSELHISAGRQSVFSRAQHRDAEMLTRATTSVTRRCIPIKDLQRGIETPFNEVDFVGLVFQIDPETKDFDSKPVRNQNFQNVYLSDLERNFVCVNFWGGIKKFGYEKVVEVGQFVSCANVQKRMGNGKGIPHFRATELSIFTKVPRNRESNDALEQLRSNFKSDYNGAKINAFCLDCAELKSLVTKQKEMGHNIEKISPYRFDRTEYNLSKQKLFVDSPCVQKHIPEDLRLTGLDFDSTFKRDSQVSEVKSKVLTKMEKLRMYGEPPPLNPMHMINKSFKVENEFRSPISEGCREELVSVENQDGSVEINNSNVCCIDKTSPILTKRHPQVKKSLVNPVKLKFDPETSRENNEKGFTEDFEYSPPLSLDANYL